MAGKIVPDPKILVNANRKLATAGIRAPSKVSVTSVNGAITVTGTIQYEHQRQSVVSSMQRVEGVKRVIDQLRVIPAVKRT